MSSCPHGDQLCPCQDNDACHYEWCADSPPDLCPQTGRRDGFCCREGLEDTADILIRLNHVRLRRRRDGQLANDLQRAAWRAMPHHYDLPGVGRFVRRIVNGHRMVVLEREDTAA